MLMMLLAAMLAPAVGIGLFVLVQGI